MPEYFRMLAGILVAAYVLVIGFGNTYFAGPTRIGLIGFLLWSASRLHANRRLRRWAAGLAVAAFLVTLAFAIAARMLVTYGVVGACSTILLAFAIVSIGTTLLVKARADTATVLGVLCIYLLLALLFAGVHQVLAAFHPAYLNGAPDPPTASDLLYFSVITMTTVGFGDLTPASLTARAVAVVGGVDRPVVPGLGGGRRRGRLACAAPRGAPCRAPQRAPRVPETRETHEGERPGG